MRRRLAGENDTDRDIRVAQETYCLRKEQQSLHSEGSSIDKPLTDIRGYISLFPDEPRCTSGLNANVGANHKQKRLESRNSCASRLSDAEGLNASEGKEPWYCTPSGQAPSRHGSDEKNQESDRVESSTRSIKRRSNGLRAEDPLSSMKRGVTGARRVHEERKKWKNEKRREIAELNRSERIDLHRDKLDIRHGKSSDQSRSSKAQHHGRQSQPYDPNSDRPEKFRQR
ncbi:MAG: hypothetical protein MMC23_009809 [Stictis urceolatum]|nr:hypothetical protein [Stictis urceolata]